MRQELIEQLKTESEKLALSNYGDPYADHFAIASSWLEQLPDWEMPPKRDCIEVEHITKLIPAHYVIPQGKLTMQLCIVEPITLTESTSRDEESE